MAALCCLSQDEASVSEAETFLQEAVGQEGGPHGSPLTILISLKCHALSGDVEACERKIDALAGCPQATDDHVKCAIRIAWECSLQSVRLSASRRLFDRQLLALESPERTVGALVEVVEASADLHGEGSQQMFAEICKPVR